MKITRHGRHLWQLTQYRFFNCYLVDEAGGLTLVDAGLTGSGRDILRAVGQIGRPLRRIALTHAHGDHIGALDAVAAAVPEAEVAFSARTAAFLRGDLALLPGEPQAELKGSFATRQTQATTLLAPGDRIGSLRVVGAPGHTPDQIAFYDERDDTLIAGDAFVTQAGTAVSGVRRLLFPFPAMATWHRPTALATARELLALRPARLAVGHGRVLENPVAEMQAAIDEAAGKFGVEAANGQAAPA
jgi:glyoxylase-like metal-dependent hydrolase (beta-lactamase superfamily II)